MASSGTSSPLVVSLMAVAAVGLLLVVPGVSAQSSNSSCTQSLLSLLPCLSYLSANSSSPSSPSSQCCSQLSTVVKTDMNCLCSVFNSGATAMPILGNIVINQTQATALPGACNIQTSEISQCNTVSSGSAIPPVSSTTVPPPSQPSMSVSPTAGNGSKVTPQTDFSGGSLNRLSLPVFFVLLLSGYGSTHFL